MVNGLRADGSSLWFGRIEQSTQGRLRKIQFLFAIAASFIVIAPLSVRADASQMAYAIKFLRIGLSVLAVFLGMQLYRPRDVGKASRSFAMFLVLFTGAAIYSSSPVLGVITKSMLLASFTGGVLAGTSIRTLAELRSGFRVIALFSLLSAVFILVYSRISPGDSYVMGRLAPMKLNANLLGQAAAVMSLLAISLAALENSGNWRRVALVAFVLLGWIVYETGSRSSVIMVAGGSTLVLAGVVGGVNKLVAKGFPILILLGPLVVFMFPSGEALSTEGRGYTGSLNYLANTDSSRLRSDMFKDTRSNVWNRSWSYYLESPLVGHGWFNSRGRANSTLNIYLQVLVETGIAGGLIFFFVLARIWDSSMRLYKCLSLWPQSYRVTGWLSLGCLSALLVHGLGESSTLLGASSNSLVLGLAIALVERLPAIYLNDNAYA